MRSPGGAWMEIVREDFNRSVSLRHQVNRSMSAMRATA